MSKSKKGISKAPGQEAALPANIVETTIISEEQDRRSLPLVRTSINDVEEGAIVTIRNRMNGAVNKMAAVYAIKLVTRDADTYEILK
jgi:hypothetical protein